MDNPNFFMSDKNNRKKVLLPLAVVSLVTGLIIAISRRDAPAAVPNDVPETPTPMVPPTAAEQPDVNFKDGTFTVDASYDSPGGKDGLDVTLTLAGGVVTDANLEVGPVNPTSQEYLDTFEAAYRPLVVGRRLDQIQLDRVSGASLTTRAFNKAVDEIEAQTKL